MLPKPIQCGQSGFVYEVGQVRCTRLIGVMVNIIDEMTEIEKHTSVAV